MSEKTKTWWKAADVREICLDEKIALLEARVEALENR